MTEVDLLRATPPSSLVINVPLDYLWDKVVTPLIAEQHDYVPKKTDTSGGGAEGGWSLRPAPESTLKIETKSSSDDGDMVGEDEIIETEDGAAPPIGLRPMGRNTPSGPSSISIK